MKLSNDFKLIVDKKTSLYLPKIEDRATLFSLIDKNRFYLREFLGWVDNTKTVLDTETFILSQQEKSLKLEMLSLSIKFEEELVGMIGMHYIDLMNHSARIGYWLASKYQSQGIMTKSVQRLIDFAFQDLKLHRIEIACATNNIKSQQIPKRLGFVKEGELRELIWHYGNYMNAYLYALIND